MATPLVTGVVALYLQRDPTMTPQQVKDAMVADGAIGLIQNRQGSPNVIVSTAALTGSSPTAPVPVPTAPVRTPNAPVRTPTATPVRRPVIPVPTPVRGRSNDNNNDSPRCRIFLGSCSSDSDCCSNKCRINVCFPF